MSLSQSIRRLTEGLRRVRREAEARDERIAALEAQLRSGEARAKAVAVPPGSTYFAGDQIRQVRVISDSPSDQNTFTFRLQSASNSGEPIDDVDQTGAMTGIKPDISVALSSDQIVGVTVEGIDSQGEMVYWLASSPSSLPPGGSQFQVLQKLSGDDGDAAWDFVRAV